MANPQLTVEIGASIDALRKGMSEAGKSVSNFSVDAQGNVVAFGKSLNTLERQLKTFQNGLKNTLDPSRINVLNSAIDVTKQKIQQTNDIISKTGFKSLTAGSNQAALALTNLGRVAQDAPFGFIGIQNNLNPLLESFQRLKAETGSTGGALKALGSSLMGAGGIGLALSAVTAIITFAQMGMRAWTGSVKDAKKAAEDYASTLETVRAVQLKGSQNAAKELTDLKILYSAYQNANLPLKSRKEAYAQLQDQYPNYFKNIAFEETATKRVTSAYNALTQAVLAEAQAQAARDKIVQNSTRQLENREKILDLEKEQLKTQQEIAKLRKSGAGDVGSAERGDTSGLSETIRLVKLEGQIKDNLEARRNLVTDSNILTSRNNDLLQFAATKQEQILDLTAKTRKEAEGTVRANSNSLGSSVGTGLGASTGQNPEAAFANRTVDATVKVTDALRILRAEYGYTNEEIAKFVTDYGVGIDQLLASTIKFNEGATNILNSGIIQGLGDIGASIGQALASGANVAEAAGMSLLSSLGGVLVQLGELAIATGVGIQAVKTALKSLNPVVAIAAGVGLVALGSIFKAKASAIGSGDTSGGGGSYKPIRQFATGGYNLPAGMALVGERGPEIVDLPTGSSVFNNAKTGRMLGNGGTNITLGAEVGISMDMLYLKLKEVEKRLGR